MVLNHSMPGVDVLRYTAPSSDRLTVQRRSMIEIGKHPIYLHIGSIEAFNIGILRWFAKNKIIASDVVGGIALAAAR